jgi:predicted TPR repeat methyltransferase
MPSALPPALAHRTSGDLAADRRYEYARMAFDEQDFEAAADVARQALDLVPEFAPARALLGRALMAAGHREAAIVALRQALETEPGDALGVRLDLARLGALPPEEAITDGYVRALFDGYARHFDQHLTGSLGYRGPALLADALRRACTLRGRPFRFGRTLDLGCGTGLMARALEGVASPIEGCDLSPRMLEEARRTGLYASLHEGELVSFLSGQADQETDLVVAADVFVYMAELTAVLTGVARVLGRDGLLAFTAQATDEDGVVLGEDARYAHSESYLRGLAEAAGLSVVLLEGVSTRRDRDRPVPGLLAVLER